MTSTRKTLAVLATVGAVVVGASAGLAFGTNIACGCSTPKPEAAAWPAVTGTTTAGFVLSANGGTWVTSGNLNPFPVTNYAYQWKACDAQGNNCVNAAGSPNSCASGSTCNYSLVSGDAGHVIRVAVTATNAGGTTTQTSAPTAVVTSTGYASCNFGVSSPGATPNGGFTQDVKRVISVTPSSTGPVNTVSMYLAGGPGVGTQTIRAVMYSDNSGVPGSLLGVSNEVAFQSTNPPGWYDFVFPQQVQATSGTPVWIGNITGGADSAAQFYYNTVSNSRTYNTNTYTDGPTNPFGTPSVASEQMSVCGHVVSAGAPSNVSAPVTTDTTSAGRYMQDDAVTTTSGVWDGGPSYSYSWQRCNTLGANCQPINGATGVNYTLTTSDVGSTLRSIVTANNANGTTRQWSNATATITGTVPVGGLNCSGTAGSGSVSNAALDSCGYPSPNTVGAPVGHPTNPQGGCGSINSPGTYSDLNCSGTLAVNVSGVTITNSKFTCGGCLAINSADNGVTVTHSTFTGSGVGCGRLDRAVGNRGTLLYDYIHDAVTGVNGGLIDVEHSYIASDEFCAGDHSEPILVADGNSGPNKILNNTLVNSLDQTTEVDVGGSWGTLSGLDIENNMLIGKNYQQLELGCDLAQFRELGTVVKNNRFSQVLFSNGGSNGIDVADTTWSGNTLDNNGAVVNPSWGGTGCTIGSLGGR